MTPELLFKLCNSTALLAWLLLAILGRLRWVSTLVAGVLVPLILAIVYTGLIVTHWGESQGNFSTLAGVASLFSDPWLLLAGWVHYLSFDLFIGCWQVRNAARNGISHWWVVPCLILTFLFGPIGLLTYFVLRFALRRRFLLAEEAS